VNKPDIVVIGSCNTDLTIRSDRLPAPGETVLGGNFNQVPGGKGANQAVAAARAGARVSLVAKIGRDVFGQTMLRRLRQEGIRVNHVSRTSTPSGVALILIDRIGENLISVASGANLELNSADVKAAEPAFKKSRCVLTQLEIPLEAVNQAAKMAVERSIPFMLNPAPATRLPRSLLCHINYLTPNQMELEILTGVCARDQSGVENAAARLQERGPCHVLVTCGRRGVYWRHGSGGKWFRTPRVKAVDSVAAGDCFAGVFAMAIARGEPLEVAVEFGVSAAAISVTRPGAQPSLPTRAEIRKFRRQKLAI